MTEPEFAHPTPNRRQQAKAHTRQRVLAAATVLFRERGFVATTIRDVARAAGLSTGAVFANFQDKNELWTVATGGSARDLAAAEELSRLRGRFPAAGWVLSYDGERTYSVNLMTGDGRDHIADADTAAAALRLAREGAEEFGPALGVAA